MSVKLIRKKWAKVYSVDPYLQNHGDIRFAKLGIGTCPNWLRFVLNGLNLLKLLLFSRI